MKTDGNNSFLLFTNLGTAEKTALCRWRKVPLYCFPKKPLFWWRSGLENIFLWYISKYFQQVKNIRIHHDYSCRIGISIWPDRAICDFTCFQPCWITLSVTLVRYGVHMRNTLIYEQLFGGYASFIFTTLNEIILLKTVVYSKIEYCLSRC